MGRAEIVDQNKEKVLSACFVVIKFISRNLAMGFMIFIKLLLIILQALIKLEGDGSFSLKNLGKSSMYLNGEEVATGQLVSLGSDDFIQVMVF